MRGGPERVGEGTARTLSQADAPLTLAALRAEIDAVDDAVLDLIARRQALAREVRRFKGAGADGLKLRPDREAHVIRRLVDRAGPADRRLVLALWRELLSAGLAIQGRVTVAVWSSSEGAVDQARLRFGVSADYRATRTWEEALGLAEQGSVIAVLALQPDAPWWLALRDRPTLWVFESLGGEAGRPASLALGLVPPDALARGATYRLAPEGGSSVAGARPIAWAKDWVCTASLDGEHPPELDRNLGVLGCAPIIA